MRKVGETSVSKCDKKGGNTQTHHTGQKHSDGPQLHGAQTERSAAHSKQRQHTATKRCTTMRGSTEAHKQRAALLYFFFSMPTQQSKIVLQCNKHSEYLCTVKGSVCLRTNKKKKHKQEEVSAVLGCHRKRGLWGFWPARAEDTHVMAFLASKPPQDSHKVVLRRF